MTSHKSVLLNECVESLDIKENGIYVDGTLGRGGHSKEILKKLKKGKLYVFDLDEEAIEESKKVLKDYDNVIYIHDNFMNMNKYVDQVDGILLDLGVSSPQFDDGDRGFSYRYDAKLDMRMNKEAKLSAYEVVNDYSNEDLARIFEEYGEERFARKIASNIVKKREEKKITTTFELVDVIKASKPARVLSQKGHPAKQVFQAIRIEVNKELDALQTFLAIFPSILKVNGRVAVITFHSLEDRLVKKRFKELSSVQDDLRIAKRPEEIETPDFELVNKKAITATESELKENSRAKSAKLRAIRKVKWLWQH